MVRKPENLPRHELIGLDVSIPKSADKNFEGLKGRLVDETKKTFTVLTEEGTKMVPKKTNEFVFELENTKVKVDGRLLVGRPEERVGKKLPGKWSYIR